MKRDLLIAVIAVVVVVAVSYGIAAVTPDLPLSPSQPFVASQKKTPRKIAADDKVVMRVNGEPITEREFAAFVESAPEEARPFYASPAGRRALADELVKLKALEQEAERLGLTEEPEVRTQIDMARAQIAASRALEKLADERLEQRMQAEYEKEKASSFLLRHILIAYAGGAVPARGGRAAPSREEAMQKAQALVTRLRAGAEFADVARAESDDEQSAQQGGALGPARPEMLPPDIAKVVQALKPGEISQPVPTQFGIHIFKIDEPSLEELRPMLRQRIRAQAAEEELKRLQQQANVELDPSFFGKPPAAQPAPNTKGSG